MSGKEAEDAPAQNPAACQRNRFEALKAFKKKCGYMFKASFVNLSEGKKCILVQDRVEPEGRQFKWGEDEELPGTVTSTVLIKIFTG